MSGGDLGNDTYLVDDARRSVIENPGEGTDTVQTVLNAYTLPANVEILTFTGAGAFTGTGNAGNNTINGGAGNDTLRGLAATIPSTAMPATIRSTGRRQRRPEWRCRERRPHWRDWQ